jgi:hypothetical protein
MALRKQTHGEDNAATNQQSPQSKTHRSEAQTQYAHPAAVDQQTQLDAGSQTPLGVLKLQGVIGNRSTSRLVARAESSGPKGVSEVPGEAYTGTVLQTKAVQRKDGAKAAPTTGDVDVKSTGENASTSRKPVAKTTNVTFIANYEEVPGRGKDKVAQRGGENALWFDPLAIFSYVPRANQSILTTGVVAGGVVSKIGPVPVPVTEKAPSFGWGLVKATMRFANRLSNSFRVKVTFEEGKGSKGKARNRAKAEIEKRIQHSVGDTTRLETDVATHLQSTFGYKVPRVEIEMKKRATKQVGMAEFYYRAFRDPLIEMEIEARPIGEKRTQFTKTETTGRETETESERHGAESQETVDVRREKVVTDVLTDLVKRVDVARTKVIETLRDQLYDDIKFDSKEKLKRHRRKIKTDDLTRKLERYEEAGKKKNKNWAAKGKGFVGKLKKIFTIPIVDRIPGVRRLRKWQLDLVEEGFDLFAEEKDVDYKDVKETETTTGGTTGTTDVTGERTTTGSIDRDIVRRKDFVRRIRDDSSSVWDRFRKRVISIKEDYSKVTKAASGGWSDRTRTESSQSTTVTFSGTTIWKFTKPAIKAKVVDGSGDVSDSAFNTPKSSETDASRASTES